MTLSIAQPSPRELELRGQLRKLALAEIDRRNLTTNELADSLQMLPIGIEMLLQRSVWPIEVGIRVVEALGVDVRLDMSAAACLLLTTKDPTVQFANNKGESIELSLDLWESMIRPKEIKITIERLFS